MLAASQLKHATCQISVLFLMIGLIVGCSRDNPLSTPEEYVEPETPFCTDESPFSFELLKRVDFTNTNDDFVTPVPGDGVDEPAEGSVNNQVITYHATAPYLSNFTVVTPIPLTDYKRNELGEVILNEENQPIILLLNKEVSPAVSQNLSEEKIEELEEFVPEVNTISYSIVYSRNGETVTDAFDEDLVSLSTDLLEGQNDLSIKINATTVVPITGLECEKPSNDSIKTRSVTLAYELKYSITRDALEEFTATVPDSAAGLRDLDTTGIEIKQNDEFGNVIALNDNFLVLGVPNENSAFQGVVAVSDLVQDDLAISSGAAFVFTKDENNLWVPHSVIKSSNNEAGDLFGTAVSIYGSTMAISAPGEDSYAAGIHENDANNTSSLKINNTAENSGAVYFFVFDEETNRWKETHYIKPKDNVISDGSFNTRFGEKLQLADNILLLAAPGEDSVSGIAGDSSLPDSGIVYTYSVEQTSPLTYSLSFLTGLKAFNPGAGDLFGSTLALNERFIAIGAPFEDNDRRDITNNLSTVTDLNRIENNNRLNSGAVYIFSRNEDNSAIQELAFIKSSNSDADDFFGSSLAIDETVLFVGAPGEDGRGTGLNRDLASNTSKNSGAVYLYSLNNTINAWFETSYIKAIDNQAGSNFGQFIGFDKNNLVIGAPAFDTELYVDTGKVYLYQYKQNEITYTQGFDAIGNADNMNKGKKLAIKNRHLILGASRFTGTDSGTGNDIPFMGKVITYQ